MANYYCQVAGLPDVAFDGSKAAYTVERFRDELYPALSAAAHISRISRDFPVPGPPLIM